MQTHLCFFTDLNLSSAISRFLIHVSLLYHHYKNATKTLIFFCLFTFVLFFQECKRIEFRELGKPSNPTLNNLKS